MCGIAGVFKYSAIGDHETSNVRRMVDRMVHRGPDSDGFFKDRNTVLGMRRLSIIDLAGGRQPLFSENHDIALVCNGEIYNHVALRNELAAKGHVFSTGSDAETIIHLYEEYGIRCLDSLRGMFAFALWDKNKETLFLVRDRIGEKPLYLCRESGEVLWFASEIRSLLEAQRNCPVELCPRGANLFLSFQYIPEPHTLIKGISLLPAGHYLALTPNQKTAEPIAYWDLSTVPARTGEPVEEVRSALSEACRLMGTADVPVGVALSGGIDSSLVAALTAKHYPGQVHTFSVGYSGRPETDERSVAGELAAYLKLPFTEVELSTDEVVAEFPRLVYDMDTPVGDIAAYGYYTVSRAARAAGVPVLLSGMGGDEFFWGYDWVRQAVERNLRANGAGWRGRIKQWFKKAEGKQGLSFFEVHDELRYGDSMSRQIFSDKANAELPDGYWLLENSLETDKPMDLSVSALLVRTWLRSNCLTLCDRVSMAHSVEMRLPLLDVELIELVTGLRRSGLNDWRRPHKWLLINAIQNILPPEVLKRKKSGFTPPITDWLIRIIDRYQSLLHNGALVNIGLLNQDVMTKCLDGIAISFKYKLILLELWTRLVVLGEQIDPGEVAWLPGSTI